VAARVFTCAAEQEFGVPAAVPRTFGLPPRGDPAEFELPRSLGAGSDGSPADAVETADALLADAVVRSVPGAPGVAPDERPRLCMLLVRRRAHHGALRWLGGPLHDAAQRLWLELVRAAPPPWGAPPAGLLAVYVYARGDGVFARVCAERALADDPDNALAEMVHDMLDSGVPPEGVTAAARVLMRRSGGCP
jgi:hypothetical protein